MPLNFAKQIYHVTNAIHNARTPERIAKIPFPLTEPIPMTKAEEIILARKVCEIVKKDHLSLFAYNSCRDHIHLIMAVQNLAELRKTFGKMKSITARHMNIHRGLTQPTSETEAQQAKAQGKRLPTQNKFWAECFDRRHIKDREYLETAVKYINGNRFKHDLSPHLEVEKIAARMVDHETVMELLRPAK